MKIVQGFEPSGVASRSVQECLVNQLLEKKSSPTLETAVVILRECFSLLEQKKGKEISRFVGESLSAVKASVELISNLNPRSASGFYSETSAEVIPDVRLKPSGEGFAVELNPMCYPRLTVNKMYLDLLKDSSSVPKSEAKQIKEKFNEADSLVKSLQSRGDTIMAVASHIISEQKEFFSKGSVALKPMVLQGVADALGLHASTVSRATNGKYIQTPNGVLELKFFLNSSVSQFGVKDKSSAEIKARIKQIIENEDKIEPLSDQSISVELKERFRISAARRTIAKYRESIGLLSSSERKLVEWDFED